MVRQPSRYFALLPVSLEAMEPQAGTGKMPGLKDIFDAPAIHIFWTAIAIESPIAYGQGNI